MKKTIRNINVLLAIFSLFLISGNRKIYGQNARTLKVKKGHPVLFVSKDNVRDIKAKKKALSDLHLFIKNKIETYTDNPEATDLIRKEVDTRTLKGHVDYFIEDCSAYGIDACLNGSTLSKAYARQYILSLLDRPIEGDDMPVRGKLFALGALYDWMYDDIGDDLKKQIRNEILDMIDYIDRTWGYVSNAVVDGHSRFGNISVLVGLLPIYHDVENVNKERYYKYLQLVIDNWTKKFNPFQTWVNRGGSHSMGWAYGASYSRYFPYIVWEFATNEESWLVDWQRDKPYFYLYGLRNDFNQKERNTGAFDNFPFSADVWASDYTSTLHGLQVLFSASHYKDPYAEWFYEHMKQRNIDGYMFKDNMWDILYNNFSDSKMSPPDDLPLSRFFPHSAFVSIRDNWDFNKNTLVVFKSSSFYAAGHHHKDQNAFTVYYKGPLAIDSGTYEAAGDWGSKHFWNYYTRSVAHNTILIYDPDEKFRKYSNDGGQYFFESDNPDLQQIKEGGSNHLDGIIHYEEGVDYTYTVGDATKAYRSEKLKLFQRSMVYLRHHSYDHPVIIVFDKVISTKPELRKTYLLHSIREPEVKDRIVKISIDDGMNPENQAFLFEETILPERSKIVKIGGRENNQEFFVHDDGHGKPHNYNEKAAYKNPSARQKRELREAGEWRVEISPEKPEKEDLFLNVLSVTDGEEGYAAVKTQYVSSENINGVMISDNDRKEKTMVLFCSDRDISKELIKMPEYPGFDRILFTGLETNANYTVKGTRKGLLIRKEKKGNLKSSDQGTLYLNSSYKQI